MTNRRAHIRYDFRNEIRYVRDSWSSGEALRALTVDISDSGIGVYAFNRLRVGEEITVTHGLEHIHRKYTVAWCKELGDDVFRAGLFSTVPG